jgi:hypothetical protein
MAITMEKAARGWSWEACRASGLAYANVTPTDQIRVHLYEGAHWVATIDIEGPWLARGDAIEAARPNALRLVEAALAMYRAARCGVGPAIERLAGVFFDGERIQ